MNWKNYPLLFGLLGAFLLSDVPASAQPSVTDLQQYFNTLRQAPYQPLPASALTDTQNGQALIDVIIPYCNDSTEMVRSKAYYALKRIGQRSTSENVRRRAVHQFVLGMRDASAGIVFVTIDALTGFAPGDFADIDRDSIGTFIRPNAYHLDEALKLAGYLQLTDYTNRLRDIINSTATSKDKWAARVSLARMGEEEAIRYIERRLSRAVVNDDFVYYAVPDLVYTRQKRVFTFLDQIIQSDEANCTSGDPDGEQRIPCAYRVMEYVAPALVDGPLEVDESGELFADDFEEALTTLRNWINQNPDYTIRTDSY